MSTDYRKTAYSWAGPGRDVMVDTAAHYLHYNESLHMHEDIGAECCAYCWLRAGKAIRALVHWGLVDGADASEFMALRRPTAHTDVVADEVQCLKCRAYICEAGQFEPTLAHLLAIARRHKCLPRVGDGEPT